MLLDLTSKTSRDNRLGKGCSIGSMFFLTWAGIPLCSSIIDVNAVFSQVEKGNNSVHNPPVRAIRLQANVQSHFMLPF